MINREMFYKNIREFLFNGSLTQPQVDGCNKIIAKWEGLGLTDLRELSYILATTYHETGCEMQPIHERGGNQYFKRLYDVQGNNPRKARELGNDQPGDGVRYHGRGFVMITGKHNYRKFAKRYDQDLVNNPDLTLDLEVATDILFDGMLEGLFTGKRLSDYINEQSCDYISARRIVNGMDKAAEIAIYASLFEDALKGSSVANDDQAAEVVIKNRRNDTLVLSAQTVKRVVVVNCENFTLDLRHVSFTEKAEGNIHIVEIRGGKDNLVHNITHHCDYTDWTATDWEGARQGIKVGGLNNKVKNVSLKGVRFGVELVGRGAKAHDTKVFGFSYDAIRMTASNTELHDAVIEEAFLANLDNHSDAIQLYPQADPFEMHKISLEGITIQNVRIANDSTKPGGNWMQGVFLTDGRIHESTFEDIVVNSDHQHGLSLAEAHDCTLNKVNCASPDPDIVSHISVNTRKPGYNASRNVRLQNCDADLILIG